MPRLLRGLFERDHKLLGVLSQTAYAAILKSFQALFGRTDVRPGCVASLQTFGAYALNWNPHAHALNFISECLMREATHHEDCRLSNRLAVSAVRIPWSLSPEFPCDLCLLD